MYTYIHLNDERRWIFFCFFLSSDLHPAINMTHGYCCCQSINFYGNELKRCNNSLRQEEGKRYNCIYIYIYTCVCILSSFVQVISSAAVSPSFFVFFFFLLFSCTSLCLLSPVKVASAQVKEADRPNASRTVRRRKNNDQSEWCIERDTKERKRQEKQMPSLWWNNAAWMFKMKWLCQMKDALSNFHRSSVTLTCTRT